MYLGRTPLRDLFDYSLSIGTIHNRVTETVQKARKINQTQDLSAIEVALLDELFQSNRPVLTGEVVNGYCLAVRSALSDDGHPPLDAPGVRLHKRLTQIHSSLEGVEKRGNFPNH